MRSIARRLLLMALALAALLGPQVSASSDAGQRTARFRSGIELVTLTVTVTDHRRRFVDGLAAADFAVFEDGVRQPVEFAESEHVPIDLALLLDTSGSMLRNLGRAQTTAIRFIESLSPGARVMVVGIKEDIEVLHPLDDVLPSAVAAVERARAGGSTALFDGLYLAFSELARARRAADVPRRQALVLLSDGADTGSRIPFDNVIDLARESGITVYAIASPLPPVQPGIRSTYEFAVQPNYVMRSLSRETGGLTFFVGDTAELERMYAAIAEELAHQYTVAYAPDPTRAAGRRRIDVQIVGRPELVARTRTGHVVRK